MERKYKSDAFQAIHEDAEANFEIGAISEKEMKEFDKVCLVEEAPVNPRPLRVPSATVYAGKR
jgi:putative transcriptional regulator